MGMDASRFGYLLSFKNAAISSIIAVIKLVIAVTCSMLIIFFCFTD